MSYDFRIATSSLPKFDQAARAVAHDASVKVEGSMSAGVGNVVFRRGKACFMMDGPHGVEPDDLDEPLLAAVLTPKWLLSLSIPAASGASVRTLALRVAAHIASECQGAVFDPQKDAIVWPKGKSKRFPAPAEKQRIDLVNLEWFFPSALSGDRKVVRALIKILGTACPEALPTRFGTFEPFQGKTQGSDYEGFIEAWIAGGRHDSMLHWKGASPCFGGHVRFPMGHEDIDVGQRPPYVGISLGFDGRALADPRWCEAVVGLFRRVASDLGAFYAMAYVSRNAVAGRGLGFDGRSEYYPLPCADWWQEAWQGLPSAPTWLAWFGHPYRSVRPHVPAALVIHEETNGFLLQMGPKPMNLDELGSFPKLPMKFLATKATRAGARDSPAEFMPTIEKGRARPVKRT